MGGNHATTGAGAPSTRRRVYPVKRNGNAAAKNRAAVERDREARASLVERFKSKLRKSPGV